MANISTNIQTINSSMNDILVTYGAPSAAAHFDPILNFLGSKVANDSIAMSGATTSAAQAALEKQYGQDVETYGANLNAILMTTSGIPGASQTAVSNDLFALLNSAASQMAPVDPNALAEIDMGMGKIDAFDPFGASAIPGLAGAAGCATPGAYGGAYNPFTPGSSNGPITVTPDSLGLGTYDYFAEPDVPTQPPVVASPAATALSTAATTPGTSITSSVPVGSGTSITSSVPVSSGTSTASG